MLLKITDQRRYPLCLDLDKEIPIEFTWEHSATILDQITEREFILVLDHKTKGFLILESTGTTVHPLFDQDILVALTDFFKDNSLLVYRNPALGVIKLE